MRITGFINDQYSTIQPLNATAILEAGSVSGLSDKAVIKVTIPGITVLKSVVVTEISIDGVKVFGSGTGGRLLGQVGNALYFETNISNEDIDDLVPLVTYILSEEDLEVVKLSQPVISSIQQYLYVTSGEVTYRIGVRSGMLVKDVTLTPLGFSGVEDTDWENLEGNVL